MRNIKLSSVRNVPWTLLMAMFLFAPGCDHGFGDVREPDAEVGECGNGQIESSEACDDGNISDHDGCSSACEVETGWVCSGVPSACGPVCGDGHVVGSEGCDDENNTDGDGRSAACKVQPG